MVFLSHTPFSELTDEGGKKEIEHWVDRIYNTSIGQKILKEYPDRYINIRTFGMAEGDHNYDCSLPKDLFYKVCDLIYPPTD